MRHIVLIIGICLSEHLASAEINPPKEKWINLFNGKDLSGWKQVNGKAKYEVIDGVIVGTTVKDTPNSFMITEKMYGDFILEVTFRIDEGMNSGIQFRSLQAPGDDGRVMGYQMEVDNNKDRGWSGGIYDEARRGWLYPVELNPLAKSAYKWGDWNTYRIECIGSSIRTWVNNMPVSYLMDDLTPSGFIALQVHSIGKTDTEGKKTYWKNIRIQTEDLVASPINDITLVNLIPNLIAPLEKQQGYRLLWDGQTTTGWRSAFGTKFPEKGWEIKDGTLSVLSSNGGESINGGDIVTEEKFSSFELQFDFKFTEGANSGVKYFVDEKYLSKGSAIGLEFQILDNEKHPDAKAGAAGNRTAGSLYDLIPPFKFNNLATKANVWNRGKIIVYPDNRIEHWLNGVKVVEYKRGTPLYNVLVARSKYVEYDGFGMAPQGPILLQDHGNLVSFRSIKIRELK